MNSIVIGLLASCLLIVAFILIFNSGQDNDHLEVDSESEPKEEKVEEKKPIEE